LAIQRIVAPWGSTVVVPRCPEEREVDIVGFSGSI